MSGLDARTLPARGRARLTWGARTRRDSMSGWAARTLRAGGGAGLPGGARPDGRWDEARARDPAVVVRAQHLFRMPRPAPAARIRLREGASRARWTRGPARRR